MASVVIMPKQGLLMETGVIANWLVEEGGACTEGQPLFEMETDKLTITMDSTATGTLLKIIHGPGDEVPITMPIAIVGEPGEDISALLADCAGGAAPAAAPAEEATAAAPAVQEMANTVIRDPGERVLASPRAKLRAEEKGVDIQIVGGSGPDGFVIERDVLAVANQPAGVTPLAARMAQNQGIDTSGIAGTGPNGKVTTADLPGAPAAAAPAVVETAQAQAPSGRGSNKVPMSGMRKAIMKNMLASKTTNAQTSHRICVDMSAAMALRNQYKALGIKISYNDIIVRACAKSLQDMPILNASVDGNNIEYHDYVNVGTAVSVPGGLIVPVIKDADIIGLAGIAKESAALIEKARDGKLTDTDYRGGTFTVSSLGMFDIDDFVAIINPPESGILAVGKIAKTPVVEEVDGEDTVVIRPICNFCLSYDHRIVDGAEAAKFMKALKGYLQTPVLML